MHRRILAVAAAGLAVAALILSSTPASAAGHADRVRDARKHHGRYLSYAVLGDSITAGAGTSDWIYDASGGYVRVSHRWGYGEQARLRAFGVGSACVAGDYCGADPLNTNLVAQRWFPMDMKELHRVPRTIVTHIGINDLAFGHTAEEVVAGLRQLRRVGRTLGIRVVFGTIGPSTAFAPGWNATQPERIRVNEWIRDTQTSYVDYARALEGPDGWLRPEFESLFHDVHVNDAGAAAMASEVRHWVEKDASTQTTGTSHG